MALSVDLNTALIVIDVQKDFCAGGVLPVKDAEKIIPVLNQYVPHFQGIGAPILATAIGIPKIIFLLKNAAALMCLTVFKAQKALIFILI